MTKVIVFGDPTGWGVYGYVPEADYTYTISEEALYFNTGPNGFSAAEGGFVFRARPEGGGAEYLAYSQGGAVSQILYASDGGGIANPNLFVEFAGETVYREGLGNDLSITQGSGAPIRLFDTASDYQVIGDSLYVLTGGDLVRVRDDLSTEVVADPGEGPTTLSSIAYYFEFQGDVWIRGGGYFENDFFRYDTDTGVLTEMNIAENSGGDSLYFYTSGAGDNLMYGWINPNPYDYGLEPFVSDGTDSSWSRIKDIYPGSQSSYYSTAYVDDVATLGDLLIFAATPGGAEGDELWVTDGTEVGTMALSGAGTPAGALSFGFGIDPYIVGDQAYFIAYRADIGRELFVTDGTIAGTRLVEDFNPGTGNASVEFLGQMDGYLIFSSRNLDGTAIWKTDGITVEMITDPNPEEYPLNNEVASLGIFDLDPANIPVEPIIGTSGDDDLTGTLLFERFEGKVGNDTMAGGEGDDTLIGSAGMDVLHGQGGNDDLYGGYDDDEMNGNAGNDFLFGGVGQDTMVGGGGHDDMSGGLGHDSMQGGSGNDVMFGDAGNDSMHGGSGKDQVFGGSGDDVLSGASGTDVVFGGLGDDTISGGGGADSVLGGDGKDVAYGDAGNDTLSGDAGTDTLDGGSGDDLVHGDGGADLLLGGIGNDTLIGGPGNDTIIGGEGIDQMSGEGGADVFVFQTVADSPVGTPDAIMDFEPGSDVIDLSDLVPGLLTARIGASFTGTAPELRTQEVGGSTVVRIDVDGNGSSDMRIILDGTTGVTETDFLL
ncbi:M10 family metallopeptidase C-terminal domain-containing protein [Psychromarinibacter halotolerans]|uniref:M10 family metallopeptidase C-terminal domain-containing protein n=1 Tax=Psychromarinibacter halotolerans TaxID=1775175 RepID=A0ABV7GQJ5_9RHOB|nr:M10 family metallopeptidase C-terminal domain-containing protein [Psychromarinibacter halotolerans]MDF0595515.1 M10 family metallopeptidase C-terminal domain-containing protein [Psychromarinibacter halotolerans]